MTLAGSLLPLVGQLASRTEKALETFRIVKHDSARAIYLEDLRPFMEMCNETDPNQLLLNGHITPDQAVEGLEDQGFWGFANPSVNEIHAWVTPTTSRRQLLVFLAHEIEHLVYRHQSAWKSKDRMMIEERRCDLTGVIALRAYEMAVQHWPNIMNGGTSDAKKPDTRKTSRPSKSKAVEVAAAG